MSTLAASLATSLARALDPVLIAESESVGLTLDPWQSGILRSRPEQTILLCSRQAGKSTAAALMAVDELLHHAPALVLITAPAQRQSQELFRRVRHILRALGEECEGDDPGEPGRDVSVASETALTLELATGSRVIALPGKETTVRTYSAVSLLLIDEAARVSDALYQSVRPMLAVSRGRIALLSTPFGKRGFFHAEWLEGGEDWHRVKVTAHDCPRIDPRWLERERQRVGDWWFRQEYLCEFVQTDDAVFSYDSVIGAISDEVQPLFATARRT